MSIDIAQGPVRENVLLDLTGVQKVFPNGTVALRGVDLAVTAGSVHGLIGANGAGKSTLVKIVSGAHDASSGTVRWRGVEQHWTSPGDARAAGVATNYQHVPLVPSLSVLENVFLGDGGLRRKSAELERRFAELQERIGYEVDGAELVADLPIGSRQMVAIMQALAIGAELVILDEPTASLSEHERSVVFDVVKRLSAQGTSFLYVSHFLDEILALTDYVTVLRDGRVVMDRPTEGLDENALVRAVAGRDLLALERSHAVTPGPDSPVLLDVQHLSSPIGIRDVSFTLLAGEVIGLAGLLGSGRSEILQCILGADREVEGKVLLAGRPVPRKPTGAIRAGLAYVPEDRTRQGLFPNFTIWQNASIADIQRLTRWRVFPSGGRERERARKAVVDLAIKTKGIDASPSELSGGNAQKVVFGRWLYGSARLWLLDEPTAGIDVGAKADILLLTRRLAAEGKGVIIVSSEFEELLAVCSRILVIREGRVIAERLATETDEDELLMLANGLGEGPR
ncbi:MAG: sugar ABC transporter ATP-binding protein [Actinomycetes bacterium]